MPVTGKSFVAIHKQNSVKKITANAISLQETLNLKGNVLAKLNSCR